VGWKKKKFTNLEVSNPKRRSTILQQNPTISSLHFMWPWVPSYHLFIICYILIWKGEFIICIRNDGGRLITVVV